MVFPPAPSPPIPQEQHDAATLYPHLHREFTIRNVTVIPEAEIMVLAKNLQLTPTRTRAALMLMYGIGEFQLVPRTINGRSRVMIERHNAPYLLR